MAIKQNLHLVGDEDLIPGKGFYHKGQFQCSITQVIQCPLSQKIKVVFLSRIVKKASKHKNPWWIDYLEEKHLVLQRYQLCDSNPKEIIKLLEDAGCIFNEYKDVDGILERILSSNIPIHGGYADKYYLKRLHQLNE